MKITLLILFITAFVSCNQPVKGRNGVIFKSASQYNDFIVGRQTAVMKNVMDFVRVSETNLDSAETMLDEYVVGLEKIIEEINGLPPYKGDSVLRDAAAATFVFYKRIFSNEYKELIDIRKKGGAFTEEGVTAMNQIVDRITQEEDRYDKAFHNAQRDFAAKNNMKLTDNEMQKQMDKLNKKYN